ncbi:hypothetical protein PsYK624_051970 [Phanerochaete sordida]|uniref:Uncharacterized protein n=1 Tax=Phanerochaete sordida TaxID=48140 RepID=A0A9P3G7A1_9APHY|nr:hypothetical protein PsYK624_051970 [Phanerochaete sordida]
MSRQCPTPPSNALPHSAAVGTSGRTAAPDNIPIDPVLVALDNWGPEFLRLIAPVAASVGAPLPNFGYGAGVQSPHAAASGQCPLQGGRTTVSSRPYEESSSRRAPSSRTGVQPAVNNVHGKAGPTTHRAVPSIEALYAQAMPRPVIWQFPALPPYAGTSGQTILPPHSQPPAPSQDHSNFDSLYVDDDFAHHSLGGVEERPPSVPFADSAAANISPCPGTQDTEPEDEKVREALLMLIPPSPQNCPFPECNLPVDRDTGAAHVRSAHKDMFNKKKAYVCCPVPECGARVGPANYAKHYLSHLEKHPCPNGCGSFLSRISQYEMKRHQNQCAKNLQERKISTHHDTTRPNEAIPDEDPTAAWVHSFPLQTWHTPMTTLSPTGHSTHVFTFSLPLAQAAPPLESAQYNFNLPKPPSDSAPATPQATQDRLVERAPSATTSRRPRGAAAATQAKTVKPQESALRRSTRPARSSALELRTGKRTMADHAQPVTGSAMKRRKVEEE